MVQEKLYTKLLGEFFASEKTWGNCLREIFGYQKSRGNDLGELITNLKIQGKPARGNSNKKIPLNIFQGKCQGKCYFPKKKTIGARSLVSLRSMVSYTVIHITQSMRTLNLLCLYEGLTRAQERQVGLACSVREREMLSPIA